MEKKKLGQGKNETIRAQMRNQCAKQSGNVDKSKKGGYTSKFQSAIIKNFTSYIPQKKSKFQRGYTSKLAENQSLTN